MVTHPFLALPAKPKRGHGFTLTELMVVVAILAILASVATPAMRAFIEGQQIKGLAYDLTVDLLMARSEALKRNASVSIVPNNSSWGAGWTSTATASSTRISTRNANGQDLIFSGAPSTITFDVNGRVSAPTAEVRMTISGSSTSTSRCVELSVSGRASSSVGACS